MPAAEKVATVTVEVIETARIPTPRGYVFRRPGNRLARFAAALDPRGGTIDCPVWPTPCATPRPARS